MKTDITRQVERALWNHLNDLSKFAALEVQFGFNRTGRPGTEIIDCVTFETDSTFRCYEIKTSVSDLRYGQKPTFVADYNYWVVTEEVYEWMKENINTHQSRKIGIFVYKPRGDRGILKSVQRAKKQLMYMSDRTIMMESMVRSLNREARKYYKLLEELEE